MSIKRTISSLGIHACRKSFGLLGIHRAAALSAQIVESLAPIRTIDTAHGSLKFFCPGAVPLWRAETLLTKEPETVEWIDTFGLDDVFWDIGANVGVYSLYAALKPRARVVAFEPAAVNAYVLNRNIEVNGFDDRVVSLCLAFADTTCLDSFYMATTAVGGALHGFAQPVDYQGKPFKATFRQGILGFTIDEFVERFHPPFPNHIKIDVDGIEDRIIAGAERTLADQRVQSVLVELETDRPESCQAVIKRLDRCGLRLTSRKHAAIFDSGPFSAAFNHIFVRT